MVVNVRVEERDTGLRAFKAKIEALRRENLRVHVGVVGAAAHEIEHEADLTNAELAAIHEYGSSDGRIPERSFLRSTFAENRSRYVRELGVLLKRGFREGIAPEEAFKLMGERISADVKKRITTGPGIPPPNAPSTIERKGSSRPLVDTGALLNSITYEVKRGEP